MRKIVGFLFLGLLCASAGSAQEGQQQVQASQGGQYQSIINSQAQQQSIQQIGQYPLMNPKATNDFEPKSPTVDIRDIHGAMDAYRESFPNLCPINAKGPNDSNLIQLCLLLDTSNSMDGLINQAKSQLWTIVNELAKAKKGDKDIRLEVALYEYGNSGLAVKTGYIRQVTPFTEDLDLLSESLFALTTNGGSEYCGYVIGVGLNQLEWNQSSEGLKIIYIAGNEPFSQGPVNFQVTCGLAAERMTIVNTIHCGDYQTGINTSWQEGATIGKGSYFAIDSDQVIEGIPSPYDDELIRLNGEMNQTYIPYGQYGQENFSRQEVQDLNASSLSKSIFAGRAVSKGSKLYKNSSWDLVDGVKDNSIKIEKINRKYLPENLQEKSDEELQLYVEEKGKERQMIQSQIVELSKKRAAFIQEKVQEEQGDKSLGSAIIKSLQSQAKNQNFRFDE